MRLTFIVISLAISFAFVGCPKTASDQAPVLNESSKNACASDDDCNPKYSDSIMKHKVCVRGPYADQGCIGQCAMPQFQKACTSTIVNAEGKDITVDLNQLCNAAQPAGSAPQQYWYCEGAGPSNCPYYLAKQGFCGCCSAGLTGCFNYSNSNDPSPYCVDVQSDLNNCGACGNVCPSGSQCSNGVCTPLCSVGQTYCSTIDSTANSVTTCYATQKDANNCGGINVVCPADQICLEGKCTNCVTPDPAATVSTGEIVCAGNWSDSTAVPGQYRTCVTIDANNCGTCGAKCSGAEACAWQRNGQAVSITNPAAKCCPAGWVLVGDTCVDLTTDPNHCGGINQKCTGLRNACSGGKCVCPGGLTYCSTSTTESCSNLSIDFYNCGACGNKCSPYNSCESGTCVCDEYNCQMCKDGRTTAYYPSDNYNCGTCGNICPANTKCCWTDCVSSDTWCGGGF